jgi:hypothetical protein
VLLRMSATITSHTKTHHTVVQQLLFKTSWTIKTLQEAFADALIGEDERSASRVLAVLANRICNSLLRHLEEVSRDLVSGSEYKIAENEVRTISYLVDSLAQTLEVIKNTRNTGNLDFIVRPFEHLVKSIHYDTRIIVTPVTEYNYTYEELVGTLVEPTTNIEGVSRAGLLHDDVSSKIVRLGFPIAESGNVLSYSGLAHEISHFVYEVQQLESAYSVSYSDSQYAVIEQLAGSDGAKSESERAIEQSNLEEEITSIVYSWIKEIVCDCLAFHIMGPCFLFTLFQALSLRGDIYRWKASDAKKYYPPPIMRFRNIFTCLAKMNPLDWSQFKISGENGPALSGFKNLQRVVDNQIKHIDKLSDPVQLKLDRKHQLAYELTESTLNNLHQRDFFKNHTQPIAFPLESFQQHMARLYVKLSHKIPINEVVSTYDPPSREIPDFRVILNVGWLRHLMEQGALSIYDRFEDESAYASFRSDNKLLRKSLELSEFDHLYDRKGP